MKKILLFLSMFLLLVSAVSAAITDISFGSPSYVPVTGEPEDTIAVSFDVINAGGSAKSISFQSTQLNFAEPTTPTIGSVTVAGGATETVSFNVAIPSTLADNYAGTITATEVGTTNTDNTIIYTITVSSVDKISVLTYDNSNPLDVSGEEGQIKTSSFNIKNIGSTVLSISDTSFDESQLDLTDGDNDVIDLSYSPSTGSFPLTINPGETKTIQLSVNFVNNIDVDNYGGILTVTSGTASDSFDLNLNVQPEVCSDGIVKDGNPSSRAQAWLDIDVREPDNGDDFKPGETMNIEVRVKNENDDDMDVIVEAFLYNVDEAEELETVESDSTEIKDGKSETFDLELDIPTSGMDEDDTYILYVKAYEDGDEEENCNEDSVSIDIKKEKHDVVVDEFTISPSTLQCGDTARFNVKVENVGSKDESDVYVEIRNTALGLDLKSKEFDVDSDDDYKASFSFIIPQNSNAGSYEVEAIVTFDDGDESKSGFETLTVQCNGGNGGVITVSSVDLTINEANIASTADSFNLPVQVKNNEDGARTFTVELANAVWSEPVSAQTITLGKDQSSTVYLYLKTKEGISGRQSATVNVKEDSMVIASKTLNFDIEEKGFDFGSLTGNTTVFWVAGYLVVIIVLIYFVKLLFMPKR